MARADMNQGYRDTSRDPRIEDPTNLLVVHRAAHALLPHALKRGISANTVSISGFLIGAMAALCYYQWRDWRFATIGFLLSVAWLIADGLDGMIARATGSASAFGRFLDGLCDHGVFALLYAALASSFGTLEAWLLAIAAGIAHGVQSSLYEGERARYHRRLRGQEAPMSLRPINRLVRVYDAVATSLDAAAKRFDRRLAESADKARLVERYRLLAVPPMKLQALLSSNVRVIAIYLACLAGRPRLFWWFEIIALSIVALAGIFWHRRAERLSAGGAEFGRSGPRQQNQ
jgi:phosphatidylglycerophosphate synthase